MKYLYFIWIITIGVFIKIFTPIVYWFVYPYRTQARIAVYSYIIGNDSLCIRDLWGVHRCTITNDYEKVSNIKYFFYKWFIWVWLNDRVSHDSIDDITILNYILKNNLKDTKINNWVISKLNSICLTTNNKNIPFENIEFNKDEHTDFIGQLVTLIYNTDTNYDFMYYITKDKNKIFTINIFNYKIGWVPCGNTVNGIWYKTIIGKALVNEK